MKKKSSFITYMVILMCILSTLTATGLAAKSPRVTNLKYWLNGEKLSFSGENAYLAPNRLGSAHNFFIFDIDETDSVQQVFELKVEQAFVIVTANYTFVYDGLNHNSFTISAKNLSGDIKKELKYFGKRQGYCTAQRHNGSHVVVIYTH